MMDENFQIFPPLRPSFSYFQDFLDKLSAKDQKNEIWLYGCKKINFFLHPFESVQKVMALLFSVFSAARAMLFLIAIYLRIYAKF